MINRYLCAAELYPGSAAKVILKTCFIHLVESVCFCFFHFVSNEFLDDNFKISILKFPFLEEEDIEINAKKKKKKAFLMKRCMGMSDWFVLFQVLLFLSFCVLAPNLASDEWKQISYLRDVMQKGGTKIILTLWLGRRWRSCFLLFLLEIKR